MLGWWPPYRRGWKGFAQVLVSLSRAVCLTHRALKEVDPEIVCVHVDPADLYFTNDASLETETEMRQQVVFLALDLISGRVNPGHPLWAWLLQNGLAVEDLERFLAIGVEPDIVGINCYPLFGQKEVIRSGSRIVTRNRYAQGDLLEKLVAKYWERYRRPLMITETASLGKRRLEWMDQSLGAVRHLRANGVPVIGYTWWPMTSIVSWGYRQGKRELNDYMVHLGLWDLDSNLNRIETPVAKAYRGMVAGGTGVFGELNRDRTEVKTFALR
jgi:hypothetical protein